ncbi:MAG: hypothetical protein QM770_23820 [Tepidisphaeraceae bacterium]
MIETFVYAGSSGVVDRPEGRSIRLAPNLVREPVAFDAELRHPLRFREAISALHDVVVSDLRFKKKDKTAYKAWLKEQANRDAAVRRDAWRAANEQLQAAHATPLPPEFEADYTAARKLYWSARDQYSDYLRKHDPALWRTLMPSDPVITVANDVVFFECFSKDESAYGCLYTRRADAFGPSSTLQVGTTNVDYSEALYEQFQTLRTYRPTKFSLDPEGFSVQRAAQETPAHREEKIDLPNTWLSGFMKLQAAMTMPTTRVPLSRECVYSLLAFLKRNIAKRSPRALRFELDPGKPARLVLEPWEKAFQVVGPAYAGPRTPAIRVWGTRRLLVLARLLPLAESIEVHLLATGLPSFWVVRMGEMTFVLGLSGWTTNDWSRGSALDLLEPPRAISRELVGATVRSLKTRRSATLAEVQADMGEGDPFLVGQALRHLAEMGQVVFDLTTGVYRYRQILTVPEAETLLAHESEEVAAARKLVAERRFELVDRQDGPSLSRVIIGKVESTPVEILVDPDDRIRRGKCLCSYFKQYGLRNGPCRHMIALRWGLSVTGLAALQQSEAFNRMLGRS